MNCNTRYTLGCETLTPSPFHQHADISLAARKVCRPIVFGLLLTSVMPFAVSAVPPVSLDCQNRNALYRYGDELRKNGGYAHALELFEHAATWNISTSMP